MFSMTNEDRKLLDASVAHIIPPGGDVLPARIEAGTVVGCIALLPYGNRVFELAKMGVTPQVRGRGIGRRLVAAGIDRARTRRSANLPRHQYPARTSDPPPRASGLQAHQPGRPAGRFPPRSMFVLMFQHHPNRSLRYLRGIPLRRLHGSIFSRVGASEKAADRVPQISLDTGSLDGYARGPCRSMGTRLARRSCSASAAGCARMRR
ncbi:MAG: GNAT family N-acetyltransferase [Rhodanobacteraceae bacterium]